MDGTVDPDLGAWLWLVIEAGASTIVCAGPSGAGKSTLLTSLLSLVHPDRHAYFVRGQYERFDEIAVSPAQNAALLVNEISSHLPIYLWGPGLARAHQLAGSGAQMMATAHAEAPEELVEQFTGYPNNVPLTDLARWDLVIFLDAWMEGRIVRREIRAIDSFLSETSSALARDSLVVRKHRGEPMQRDFDAFHRLAVRLRIDRAILDDEISHRTAVLLEPGSIRHRTQP